MEVLIVLTVLLTIYLFGIMCIYHDSKYYYYNDTIGRIFNALIWPIGLIICIVTIITVIILTIYKSLSKWLKTLNL